MHSDRTSCCCSSINTRSCKVCSMQCDVSIPHISFTLVASKHTQMQWSFSHSVNRRRRHRCCCCPRRSFAIFVIFFDENDYYFCEWKEKHSSSLDSIVVVTHTHTHAQHCQLILTRLWIVAYNQKHKISNWDGSIRFEMMDRTIITVNWWLITNQSNDWIKYESNTYSLPTGQNSANRCAYRTVRMHKHNWMIQCS